MARLNIGQAVSFGWNATTKNFLFFVNILLILFAVSLVFGALMGVFKVLAFLVSVVVQTIFAMGLVVIVLKFVDRKQPKVSDLWNTYKPFWRYLGASFAAGLGAMTGFVLFIIPGIMLALGWQFFSYLVIDKDLDVIESLKRSWEITQGEKWRLFGLMIVLWFMNLFGALLFGVGLLWTIPTSMLAVGYAYRVLQKTAPVPTMAEGK